MASLSPFRLRPIYKNYLWGGRKFESVFGRALPADGVYAESWETADHPAGRCVIAHGPASGKPLKQILSRAPAALLGRSQGNGRRFPILLKFIDAAQPLSVQVHPDDRIARRMQLPDFLGKNEAWIVLDAEPKSVIWAGFRRPVDHDEVLAALKRGDLQTLLHRFEPRVGDCLYLPAGTVHALGAGILLAEVQQMSNNTFRLHDWGRTCRQGQARPLHIGAALRAIDYRQGPIEPVPGFFDGPRASERIFSCRDFEIRRLRIDSVEPFPDDNRCHVLAVLRGQVEVSDGRGVERLRLGDTIILPAARRRVVCRPDTACTLLDVTVP